MVLETTHPSGAEQWYCPTCGRRFLMLWPPGYKKIIMQAEDENAVHVVSKGGLEMGAVQVNKKTDEDLPADLRDRFDQILDDSGF